MWDLGSFFGSVQRLNVLCSEPQINVIVIFVHSRFWTGGVVVVVAFFFPLL